VTTYLLDTTILIQYTRERVEVRRRLHEEDLETGAITAVTQLMAAASTPEDRRAILDRFEQLAPLAFPGHATGGPTDGEPKPPASP